MRIKELAEPVEVEPPRSGEDAAECVACNTPDDAYIWVSDRWRVRAMDRPTGLPMVLILECRSHLDLGDLPNLLAAELGVMTVRLERAIRSLDGVARVHVNRWGDGSAHLHMWFLARPYGRLQLRGTFLSLWDDILPTIPEHQWRENLALVAAWLADFGGQSKVEPAHIQWQSPLTFSVDTSFMSGGSGDREESFGSSAPADDDSPGGRNVDLGSGDLPAVIEPAGTGDSAAIPEGRRDDGTDAEERSIPRQESRAGGIAEKGVERSAGSAAEKSRFMAAEPVDGDAELSPHESSKDTRHGNAEVLGRGDAEVLGRGDAEVPGRGDAAVPGRGSAGQGYPTEAVGTGSSMGRPESLGDVERPTSAPVVDRDGGESASAGGDPTRSMDHPPRIPQQGAGGSTASHGFANKDRRPL